MSRRAVWCACVFLATPLLTILLSAKPGLCADGEDKPGKYAQDSDVFRLILQAHGFTFVHSFAELPAPSEALLIVLGDVNELDDKAGWLAQFVKSGGAALVATDQSTSRTEGALWQFGLAVNGTYLWREADSDMAYRGLP